MVDQLHIIAPRENVSYRGQSRNLAENKVVAMHLHQNLESLRPALTTLRKSGTIALVPTMGALHEGHLSLVRKAKELASHVVVSIFVNPLQFGENEDFEQYHRTLPADQELLSTEGVALIWAPPVSEMYPTRYSTNVSVSDVGSVLCGSMRPGHFDGVATVVSKLFNQIAPDFALFGEKDWQQVAVIRRLARDLNFFQPSPDAIIAVPIVREFDGLAMSSRNAYLSAQDRNSVNGLYLSLSAAVSAIESDVDVGKAIAQMYQALLAAGFSSIDYIELRESESLELLDKRTDVSMRLFAAAWMNGTRLIDNLPVEPIK